MKKLLLTMVVACAAATLLADEKVTWMTDVTKATELAKKDSKLVMLDFTGSDWCGWCIKLDKEVFSTPEFKEYAAKNLVLVEVDFPHKKVLSAELTKANQSLQKKYKIQGYPTIIVLNAEGKQVGELGYGPGGPKPFIEKLEAAKKK